MNRGRTSIRSAIALLVASAASAASVATAAPPSNAAPALASYEVTLSVATNGCAGLTVTSGTRIVNIGRQAERTYLLDVDSEPEQIGTPIIFWNEATGGNIRARRTDIYEIQRLGRLTIAYDLEGQAQGEGAGLEARLAVEVQAEPRAAAEREASLALQRVYSLPCRAELTWVGRRVDTRPADVQATLRRWNLLKEHLDFLMTTRPAQALDPLEAALASADGRPVPLLWRKSRNLFLLGEYLPASDRKGRLRRFEDGIAVAREALSLDPSSGEAAFFLAANLGRRNTTVGRLREAIGLREFEASCLRAVSGEARNDTFGFKVRGDAHYALGQYYRLVPDSFWARLFLGTRGDLAKSVEHLRRALEIQPTRGDYMKELGVSLICLGRRTEDTRAVEEGRSRLRQALATPVYTYPPDLDYEHIRRLLAHPEDACRYSRDRY